jgi:hypothetical protein
MQLRNTHIWKESFHTMSSHHILKINVQTDRLWLYTMVVPWCYGVSTLYQTTDNSHVGLPLWKKKAVIFRERWKRRLSDYVLFVHLHPSRIKGGIFPRCVWMNLTVLDDRSVACGVILSRYLQQILVEARITSIVHTYTADKRSRGKKMSDSTSYEYGIECAKSELDRKRQ